MSTPTKYEGHTLGPWNAKPENDYCPAQLWANGRFLADVFGESRKTREANANLIAEAPALLAERDSLLAENTRLREALRKYGIHKTNCIAFPVFSEEQVARDCNCGLVAALAAGKGTSPDLSADPAAYDRIADRELGPAAGKGEMK